MRKREHAFILRLSNDEMHHLKKRVEKSGLSREVYVRKLVTNLIKNTTPKNASNNDPFWEKSETALLFALGSRSALQHTVWRRV